MRVLVCGTLYGSSYLRAITQTNQFFLAGILSRGSQRSVQYASQLGVPHFTTVSQISSQSIDIACVAVSGAAGQKLVLDLLAAGIHVICEHPVNPAFVAQAVQAAKAANKQFFVNAHFADLPAQQAFITTYRNTAQHTDCLHHTLEVNLRTLYSGLDLISRMLGEPDKIKVAPTESTQQQQAFAALRLNTAKADITLLCQNFASEHDDGSATYINHRCSAIFVHGNLSLTETTGPVLWHPAAGSAQQHPTQWQSVTPIEYQTLNMNQLQQQRDYANIGVLQQMAQAAYHGTVPFHQTTEYLQGLSNLWVQVLGYLQPSQS